MLQVAYVSYIIKRIWYVVWYRHCLALHAGRPGGTCCSGSVRPSARCRDLHRRHGLTIKSCPSALHHSSPVPSRVPVLHAVVRRLTREFDTADLRSVSDRFPQSLRNCNCTRENSGIQGRSQLGGGSIEGSGPQPRNTQTSQ